MTRDKSISSTRPKSMKKGTRHSKVSGQFGEILVAYLLSKEGFEVAQVDHTGLDLLAINPESNKRLGIFVKNRTRDEKSANSAVYFPLAGLKRLEEACRIFSVQPFVAAVVDRPIDDIDDSMWLTMWLMPLPTARKLNTTQKSVLAFAVNRAQEIHYRTLPEVYWASLKSDSFNLSHLTR